MGDADDLYTVLGLTSAASAQDIADAYTRLGPEAADAHDILGDRSRRDAYDGTLRARSDAAAAAATTTHGAPSGTGEVELVLTFDQAALGTTATVQVEGEEPCRACGARGTIQAADAVCSDCGGAGSRIRQSGGITIRHECRACDGTGRPPARRCDDCAGSGALARTRDVTLRIPAGVDDGSRLRFRDPSSDGADRLAVIRVQPHPYFTRNGRDLRVQLPLTIAEASLGTVVSVPTLEGAVAIRVPAGTRTGRTFRVRGRGIVDAAGRGDLLVTTDVVIPTSLNDDQRRALEAFSAATPPLRSHFERAAPVAPSEGD